MLKALFAGDCGAGSPMTNTDFVRTFCPNQDFNKIYKIAKINPANPDNLVKIVVQTKQKTNQNKKKQQTPKYKKKVYLCIFFDNHIK